MSAKLNLPKKNRKWTKEEEEFLRENLGKLSIGKIAKRLNRPKSVVHYRVNYSLLGETNSTL